MFTRRLDESPKQPRDGQISYLMLTFGQGGSENMSITWIEGEPGSEQKQHAHDKAEQAYIVVEGRGLMRVDGEEQEVGRGTVVFIPRGRHIRFGTSARRSWSS